MSESAKDKLLFSGQVLLSVVFAAALCGFLAIMADNPALFMVR